MPLFLDSAVVKDLAGCNWHGKANRLSGEHGVHWDIIDEVAAASWKTSLTNTFLSLSPASVTFHDSRFTFSRCPIGGPDHSPAAERRVIRWQDVDLLLRHSSA